MKKIDYRELMLKKLAAIIEEIGVGDEEYNSVKKSLDVLEVLEILLAFAIYNTSNSIDTIRDSSEESYFNIKRRAIYYYKKKIEKP